LKSGYDLFRGDLFIPSFQGAPEITKIGSQPAEEAIYSVFRRGRFPKPLQIADPFLYVRYLPDALIEGGLNPSFSSGKGSELGYNIFFA
jgi:hypothetical protein